MLISVACGNRRFLPIIAVTTERKEVIPNDQRKY